jgi:transposase
MVIAGANIPDFKLLEATLEAIVIERSEPSEAAPQHLCLDKGYDKDPVREVLER